MITIFDSFGYTFQVCRLLIHPLYNLFSLYFWQAYTLPIMLFAVQRLKEQESTGVAGDIIRATSLYHGSF